MWVSLTRAVTSDSCFMKLSLDTYQYGKGLKKKTHTLVWGKIESGKEGLKESSNSPQGTVIICSTNTVFLTVCLAIEIWKWAKQMLSGADDRYNPTVRLFAA